MNIESIDFFYLSMPQVHAVGDGSQDALLVRVRAGGREGWGECEAAPLPSIAGLVCPLSHSACQPVQYSVLGQSLNDVSDIARIGNLVRENSLDLLQADHILSGIDIALWDLMGRKLEEPIYRLLGAKRAFAKTPYASQLFGAEPEETLKKAQRSRSQNFRAVKFGWGPFGRSTPQADRDQLFAAREGLGKDGILLVDAGTVWGEDVEAAQLRLGFLEECRALWLEEPFVSGALDSYARLSRSCRSMKLAGGEGAHNFLMARTMMDHAALGFVQIDTGRIGGITPARQAALYAREKNIRFVNHTFTSHLALSASLQPFADFESDEICEYPVEAKSLAVELTREHIERAPDGTIRVPDAPGLGLTPDLDAARKYLVETEIRVNGKVLYSTPAL